MTHSTVGYMDQPDPALRLDQHPHQDAATDGALVAAACGRNVRSNLFLVILRLIRYHTTQQPVEAGDGSMHLQLLETQEILVANDGRFRIAAPPEDVRNAVLDRLV
jgi:hypothetical protein